MLDVYIAGLNQNSDKIFVSAGLGAVMQGLGYSSAIYKPVETGALKRDGEFISPNLTFVKRIDSYIKTSATYLFENNFSPLISAALQGISIEKNNILKDFQKLQSTHEVLIVEGNSGLGAPLNKNFLEEDLIKMLNLPLLTVASAQNDSIDSILLSINHAKDFGLSVRGVIICDYSEKSPDIKLIPKLIKEYTDIETLGTLPTLDRNINPNDLINEILNGLNLESIFNIKIPKL